MPELKKYTGGCHCGQLRYEVELDLSEPKASKCNCSFCLKSNRISVTLEPDQKDEFSQFKLLSPSSWEELGDYRFGSMNGPHYFCKTCGMHCMMAAKYELGGHKINHMSINAVTLDQGQGVDLRKFKMEYWDGKENNWLAGLKDEPWDGGCY